MLKETDFYIAGRRVWIEANNEEAFMQAEFGLKSLVRNFTKMYTVNPALSDETNQVGCVEGTEGGGINNE